MYEARKARLMGALENSMTIDELKVYLEDKLKTANEDLAESSKIDQNCYGAGYDTGVVDVIEEILDLLEE